MNARDELYTLADVIGNKAPGVKEIGKIAAARRVLAAGYTKPRTITTIEELDALADGTVVMDGQGEVARKLVYGWRVLVSESGFDAWLSDPLEETYLPATVLYEPTA